MFARNSLQVTRNNGKLTYVFITKNFWGVEQTIETLSTQGNFDWFYTLQVPGEGVVNSGTKDDMEGASILRRFQGGKHKVCACKH